LMSDVDQSQIPTPKACTPQTPEVSVAKGIKSTQAMMSAYFRDFFSSAFRAAEPACTLLSWIAAWAIIIILIIIIYLFNIKIKTNITHYIYTHTNIILNC